MHTRPAGKSLEQLLREIPELLKATLGLVRRKRTTESGISLHFCAPHRAHPLPLQKGQKAEVVLDRGPSGARSFPAEIPTGCSEEDPQGGQSARPLPQSPNSPNSALQDWVLTHTHQNQKQNLLSML